MYTINLKNEKLILPYFCFIASHNMIKAIGLTYMLYKWHKKKNKNKKIKNIMLL